MKQNEALTKKWEETFLSHVGELSKVDTFGITDVNYWALYGIVYGYMPKVRYRLANLKNNGLCFFKGTNKESEIKDTYEALSNKLSFHDTCKKLGINLFMTYDEGVYVTDIGVIIIEGSITQYSHHITKVEIISDNDDNANILGKTFLDNIVPTNKEKKDDTVYYYVRDDGKDLAFEVLSFDKFDLQLKTNYNDDLPYEDIVNLLKSNKNELILFDGKPGTGKTSLIKHLMEIIDGKNFFYIDSSILMTTSPSKFMDFMISHRDSIIVLEDCEKLLCKREQGNPFMSTLLNLTDGIIGESIKAKFICTFNCDENKIDDALLREGRLSLKYSFNELSLEKTKKLVKDANKPMTLATIYKKDNTKVVGKATETKKIGFC